MAGSPDTALWPPNHGLADSTQQLQLRSQRLKLAPPCNSEPGPTSWYIPCTSPFLLLSPAAVPRLESASLPSLSLPSNLSSQASLPPREAVPSLEALGLRVPLPAHSPPSDTTVFVLETNSLTEISGWARRLHLTRRAGESGRRGQLLTWCVL